MVVNVTASHTPAPSGAFFSLDASTPIDLKGGSPCCSAILMLKAQRNVVNPVAAAAEPAANLHRTAGCVPRMQPALNANSPTVAIILSAAPALSAAEGKNP
jgi:hypothetical protein